MGKTLPRCKYECRPLSSRDANQRPAGYLKRKRLFNGAGGLQRWELSQVTKKGMFPGTAVEQRPPGAALRMRLPQKGLEPPLPPEAGGEAALPHTLQASPALTAFCGLEDGRSWGRAVMSPGPGLGGLACAKGQKTAQIQERAKFRARAQPALGQP